MGMANGKPVAMINTEGKRGEQYADNFKYLNLNLDKPFSPERYYEAVQAMKEIGPGAAILDSATHLHDGPGGLLEYHEAEITRIAGENASYKRREACTWAAWVKPKAAENKLIYGLLELECPLIICFRAKPKIRIVTGQDPVDLGLQPIASDRIAFETLFTLMLPERSMGVPDLGQSDMRSPFDAMVPKGKAIDEELGKKLTEWAKGAPTVSGELLSSEDIMDIETACVDAEVSMADLKAWLQAKAGYSTLQSVPKEKKQSLFNWIAAKKKS
jgi:hypothetical protein